MNPTQILTLLQIFGGLIAADPGAVSQSVTRLIVRDEVIWRVPVVPRPVPQNIEWIETKGFKCVPTKAIRRALLSGESSVDFILANRARIRAKFDADCPALDFYSGLYLIPEDELLCAKRDVIHSRMGGSCEIHNFRLLKARLLD